MNQSRAHCAFNEARTSFALVHNNCIRLYDVQSGSLEKTLTPPNSMSHGVTSLAWGSVGGSQVVATGCSSGSAFVWSTQSDEQLLETTMPAAVQSVAFDKQGQLFVATQQHLRIVTFSAKRKAKSVEHQQSDAELPKGTASIAIESESGLVTVGAKKLCLVHAERGAKKFPVLLRYTGHSGPAAALQFFEGGERFASFAADEQHVSVWGCEDAMGAKDTAKKAPASTHQLSHRPVALDTQGNLLMALTDAGIVHLFDLQQDTSCVIKAHAAEGSDATLLACCFLSASEVLVAKGTLVAPFFERVQVQEGGAFLERVAVDLSSTEATLLGAGGTLKRRRGADPLPIAAETVDEMQLDKTISKINSLGFKKAELQRRQQAAAGGDMIKLTQPLQQALSTKDTRQLNDLLSEGVRRGVITATVKSLERVSGLQLLRECVKRFQSKPNSAQDMLPWIRAVLAFHSQHLLSLSNLDQLLGPLQNVIESNLSTYHQLALMKGRLDVVIGRSHTLRSSGLREKGEPLRTVDEADVRRANALLPLGDYSAAELNELPEEAEAGDDADEDDELGEFLREQGLLAPEAGKAMELDEDEADDDDEEDEEDDELGDEDMEEGEEDEEEN